jgi:hypothetical protein
MISLIHKAPEKGLVPVTHWLCSTHDILNTMWIRPKYTQETIKHIPSRIGQYRGAVQNTPLQRTVTNHEESAPTCLNIPLTQNLDHIAYS